MKKEHYRMIILLNILVSLLINFLWTALFYSINPK